MNWLNFYTKVYGKLHNYPGVPYWVLTPMRRFVRYCANKKLPQYLAKYHKYIEYGKQNDNDVIVSFTSFPARINKVWQVVECMKQQTLKPQKILLWLSKEQFPTRDCIPQSLKEREDEIFEIRMVDGDIRSHKKYYYVSKEFPNNDIFLIDDDIYYPPTILEKTWNEHVKQPDKIICNYGFLMRFHSNGTLKRYKEWTQFLGDSDDDNLFFGSGGGTLIKPSQMFKDLTNIDLAIELTPIADDIWLNAMARLAGIKIHKVSHGLLLLIESENNTCLSYENIGSNKNDEQLNNIREFYISRTLEDPFLNNSK